MKRVRILSFLTALMLGLSALPLSLAEQLPDLRSKAPEGTFLAPGSSPIKNEMSYQSEHISISIRKQRANNSDVFIADIYVADVSYLRRAFSSNDFAGGSESPEAIAQSNNAILALTGDYAANFGVGLIAANGEIIRKTDNKVRDTGLLMKTGELDTYLKGKLKIKDLDLNQVWHSFLFGPQLLNEGAAMTKFNSKVGPRNPRSVVGYFSPGHYCFVLVDGRSDENRGMTLKELSQFMADLGCKTAYNLDGGQSAMLYFNGRIISDPYNGGRRLRDIVYVPME